MRKSFTFNGKRYEVYGSSQKELDDKYFYKRLELENEVNNSVYTVSEWGEIWLEKYKKHTLNPKNFRLYKGILNNHIYPFIGDELLSSVTSNHCQLLINSFHNYSASFINKLYLILKGIFQTAKNESIILQSPAELLIKPHGSIKERRSITTEERKAILSVSSYHYAGLYIKFMLYSGLRPSECALIQGKDVKDNKLHVRGTKSKTADRWTIIPNILTLPKIKSNEYFFPNLNEQKRKRWWNSFKKEMSKYIDVEEDLTPYCLRHTFCTDLEEIGVPINIARQLMGHSNIELTSKIYTHTSDEAWNLAAERINSSHIYPTE